MKKQSGVLYLELNIHTPTPNSVLLSHIGGVLESEGASTMFHPPNKETVLTSTSTLGPKPFLFLPQQTVHHSTKVVGQPSNFLATIK